MLWAVASKWRPSALRAWRRDLRLWKSLLHSQRPVQALSIRNSLLKLPQSCPGCGTYSHFDNGQEAGRYSLTRKSVRSYVEGYRALDNQDGAPTQSLPHVQACSSLSNNTAHYAMTQNLPPVCDRCHNLLHHSTGASVEYPSIEAVESMLSESPYKQNHIYHILDAADFPLSLIQGIQRHLSLSPQRSRNRRANAHHYVHGQRREVSFIIARSDLLAPQKTQVDRLMPYLVQVLRDALSDTSANVRLGNVRCVSAKRGWWTKQLKEEIWQRGGAGWFVGKTNVGKSSLLQCVFPKGRMNQLASPPAGSHDVAPFQQAPDHPSRALDANNLISPVLGIDDELHPEESLPAAAVESNYPVLPIVSHIQGTTAAPIRLLFGGGKGELIDLPGIKRNKFEPCLFDKDPAFFMMQSRVNPPQYSIKPGGTLLIADLISITPVFPREVFLAFPFVKLESKVVSSSRNDRLNREPHEDYQHEMSVEAGNAGVMPSTSRLELKWDVTMQRATRLMRKDATGLGAPALPFRIFSADILLEGIGWIELVAQVRNKHFDGNSRKPQVEIRYPKGLKIGIRQPMNASLLTRRHAEARNEQSSRPRRSLSGTKKKAKSLVRVSVA